MILRGYRIDIIRAEAGLSVNDLAKAAKSSPQTVQKARHGKDISIMSAGRIANALHIPLDQLVIEEHNK